MAKFEGTEHEALQYLADEISELKCKVVAMELRSIAMEQTMFADLGLNVKEIRTRASVLSLGIADQLLPDVEEDKFKERVVEMLSEDVRDGHIAKILPFPKSDSASEDAE